MVGHSYIIYGPLINGSTTIMYDGVPIRPDAGVWSSVEGCMAPWCVVHAGRARRSWGAGRVAAIADV